MKTCWDWYYLLPVDNNPAFSGVHWPEPGRSEQDHHPKPPVLPVDYGVTGKQSAILTLPWQVTPL